MFRPLPTIEAITARLRKAVPRPPWVRWRGGRTAYARWGRCREAHAPDLIAAGPNSSSRQCAASILEQAMIALADAGYSDEEIASLRVSFTVRPPLHGVGR